MRNFPRALVIGVAIVICGLAMGCKQKLNTKKGEKLMKEKLAEQLGDEIEVKSVKCPKSVEAKKGESFTCTATLADDTEITLDVDQVDDDGNIEWKPEAVVRAKMAATLFEENAKKNGITDVAVDCGKPIQPMALPASIDCQVTSEGNTAAFTFSFDADGVPTWKPKQ